MAKDGTIKLTTILKPPFKSRPIPPHSAQTQPAHQNGDINATGALHASVNETLPLSATQSLPTIAGRKQEVYQANDDIAQFLRDDLNLERLNRIHGHLWMAGRPLRARPLHRYKMLGMEVLGTQQMDLHLLKFSTKLLMKPLPEWILDAEFWSGHLCDNEGKELKDTLHASACGFLLSYVWLITTPLDLKIAHEYTLLPSFITWLWWKDFVQDFLSNIDINTLHQVNKRYQFGDLRLGRINSLYRTRYFTTHFVKGYLYGYNRYVIFFQRNFSWILIVFVFFSLVLSAMQVGSGLKELENNYAFLRASYIFVVFSMVCVVAVLAFVVLVFIGIFVFNMFAAIHHAKSEQKKRKELARRKEEEGKDV